MRPTHRQYLGSLIASGQLVASGPFTDDSGVAAKIQNKLAAELSVKELKDKIKNEKIAAEKFKFIF